MSDVVEYLQHIFSDPQMARQIAAHREFDAMPAQYGQNSRRWHAGIQKLLAARNISLYEHQTLATDHIRSGKSAVIATPTASGKSLIYNLPVLESCLRDPETRALYLFPLKALSQDQLGAFNALCADLPEEIRPTAALYDGDTSDYMRRKIRANPPNALITNPEMLHLAILPFHEQWTTFLANLNYVIVDEAHTYRGVFGSHMAQVFRRLNRLTARYGSMPTYIFCTATLGNPAELAANLMGRDEMPVLIDKSGAPQGKRHYLIINPEQAPSTCAIDLLKVALDKGLRTIVYCQSRKMTELISLWAGAGSGPYKNRISAYRAGFLPEERRDIEARMASGDLLAVISTSALELGIDIGGLDVCILVGYPGTIMQTLQRGGRVGRSQKESAVIIIAGDNAMDQYFAHNPDDFFSRPPEKAIVNPDNEVILARHLECAAAEMPLEADEPWMDSRAAKNALLKLAANGSLLQSADGSQWLAARKRPQRNVDLRGSGESYYIEDEQGNVVGMMDFMRAWREAHPGAVYIHNGRSYVVDSIDSGSMKILVKLKTVNWHTHARIRKNTTILHEIEHKSLGSCIVGRGILNVTEQVMGYEQRLNAGKKLMRIVPLNVPEHDFETEGIWFVIPDSIRTNLERRFIHFMGSIHALEHAIIGLLPLEVMADRNDFGGISITLHEQLGYAAVFVYDALPGGAGLTAAAYDNARNVLKTVLEHLLSCPCEDGCPSCIQSPKCGSGNRPLSKSGAIALLEILLGPSNAADEIYYRETQAGVLDMPIEYDNMLDREIWEGVDGLDAAAPGLQYVVFDVETRQAAADVGGWQNAARMGVSVAVLYDSEADEYFTYQQHELEAMFERMAAADLVVGFNSLRFDYAVLQPFASKLQKPLDLHELPSLDILHKLHEKLHYRLSLDNLASATFNKYKTADGLQALQWWKEGQVQKIADYCREDVELTLLLYLFGQKNNFLLFRNKAGLRVRVPVDFSPAAKKSVRQNRKHEKPDADPTEDR